MAGRIALPDKPKNQADDVPESPGAALVRKRWAKTTAAERSDLGRELALRRWVL